MSQPELSINLYYGLGATYWVKVGRIASPMALEAIAHNDVGEDIDISKAKDKKTAYKRAAEKLRKLADEAERLAEES